jgi:pyridoxal phosphate enzyme (YggS family)
MNQIPDQLARVRLRIEAAARACGREPDEIGLIAVSKTKPIAAIVEAIQAGQRAFGENYLQDALPKINALGDDDITWHFIGRLQSNKTAQIAENFSWVHTVDRIKHARRLATQRPHQLPPLQVCIQVDLSNEPGKGGIEPEALGDLAIQVADLPRLTLRGLMTIPAPSRDPGQQREVFARLRELQEDLQRRGLALDTLSMGMSGDMESAIAEGSTLVRIGTDIFGPREPVVGRK